MLISLKYLFSGCDTDLSYKCTYKTGQDILFCYIDIYSFIQTYTPFLHVSLMRTMKLIKIKICPPGDKVVLTTLCNRCLPLLEYKQFMSFFSSHLFKKFCRHFLMLLTDFFIQTEKLFGLT